MRRRFLIFIVIFISLSQINVLALDAVNNIITSENADQEIHTQEMQEEKKSYIDSTENIYSASYNISNGFFFTRNILSNENYGLQREYILEYDPKADTEVSFLTNKYLYSRKNIEDIAKENLEGKNILAGINADFFNLSTGVPESAFISNYELYTTDRDSFCLARTDENNFFIDKPSIKISLIDDNAKEYSVLHLNKEFTQYGLYLYNSRYSDTTHIRETYSSAVLYPYEDCMTLEEIMSAYLDDSIHESYDLFSEHKTDNEKEKLYNDISKLTGYTEINGKFYLLSEVFPSIGKSQNVVVSEIIPENENSNIPMDAYLLCADNNTYGNIIRGFEKGDTLELKIDGNESFYDVKEAIGTGAVILKDSEIIDDRTLSHYTSAQPRSAVGIKKDGSLVFYAADGRQKNYSAGVKLLELAEIMKELGCVYAANLDGGGSTAVTVSLPGNDNTKIINSPSGGSERTISNAIVFSNELERIGTPQYVYLHDDYLITLSDWKISFDKLTLSDIHGYSVNVIEDDSSTQENDNAVEENFQNNVSDNVSLYTKDGITVLWNNELYPNGEVGRIDIYGSVDNKKTENIASTVVSIEHPDEISIITNKIDYAPFEKIEIEPKALYKKLAVSCGFDNFLWSARIIEANAVQEDVVAEEIINDKSPYEDNFSEDVLENKTQAFDETENAERLGQLNEEATNETYDESLPVGSFENGIFTPFYRGKEYELTATRGNLNAVVKIFVDDYPFADIEGHWAQEEIYNLAKKGIVNGELDFDGVAYYLPSRNYTKYEFCTMLERITKIGNEIEVPERKSIENDVNENSTLQNELNTDYDIEAEKETSIIETIEEDIESDIEILPLADIQEIPDWAYTSVYRLYMCGLLDDIIKTTDNNVVRFDGQEHITRQEVMMVLGRLCDNAPEEFTLDMYYDLAEQQKSNPYIANAVSAGLFSGYEDMSLRLDNLLTRAEAAVVFERLDNYLEHN